MMEGDTVTIREEQTRQFGLSLGDRSCLALAIARNIAVITADTAWTS
ncbi:hypothetical protein F7734_13555 [Scytonema sp. UIC 10036]|nr:hypothetical protein [Scytonema sp. UIC 10036]MUG93398.1 hypothetical protein [Scytonema sp. UIC 10036]